MRAALFNYTPPLEFAATWFLDRLFEQKPEALPCAVSPTRDFCLALFVSKIHATIGNLGEMIGWESDNETVGPMVVTAKHSLLRIIPHILPQEIADQPQLYRLVLKHGDFGIHNMSITDDGCNIISLFDWETGCIAPAILSDPLMSVIVDLAADENAGPSITRLPENITAEDQAKYMTWATEYLDSLYMKAPDYQVVIQAGRDARHLWFALRDWRGDEPEAYCGELGTWADNRYRELTMVGESKR